MGSEHDIFQMCKYLKLVVHICMVLNELTSYYDHQSVNFSITTFEDKFMSKMNDVKIPNYKKLYKTIHR